MSSHSISGVWIHGFVLSEAFSRAGYQNTNCLRVWMEFASDVFRLHLLTWLCKHVFDVLLCSFRRNHWCIHPFLLHCTNYSSGHAFPLGIAVSSLRHRFWLHGNSYGHAAILRVWVRSPAPLKSGASPQSSAAAAAVDWRGEREVRSHDPLGVAVLDLLPADAALVGLLRGLASNSSAGPAASILGLPGCSRTVLRKWCSPQCSPHPGHQGSWSRRHPSYRTAQARSYCSGRRFALW
mmetsp:Transcript_146494/g.255523  ORF Transcript_146494/g.255523 Transcript_146494/m.255523 type:complete len:237 (-) Transcript_146494:261-971(-)